MSEARNCGATRRLVASPICCNEQPSQSVFLVFEDVEMRPFCSLTRCQVRLVALVQSNEYQSGSPAQQRMDVLIVITWLMIRRFSVTKQKQESKIKYPLHRSIWCNMHETSCASKSYMRLLMSCLNSRVQSKHLNVQIRTYP